MSIFPFAMLNLIFLRDFVMEILLKLQPSTFFSFKSFNKNTKGKISSDFLKGRTNQNRF